VAGTVRFVALSASVNYTCGLTETGEAYCWGGNSAGNLGDGTQEDRLTPTLVTGDRISRPATITPAR
ncbi:MAG: hypothetical protein ACREKI_07785, partial [Gemmatimonadota bacterium]